jgi:hypothetical protein
MPSLRGDYAALDERRARASIIVTHPITFAGPVVAQAPPAPWVSTVLAPISFFSAWTLPCTAAPRLITCDDLVRGQDT